MVRSHVGAARKQPFPFIFPHSEYLIYFILFELLSIDLGWAPVTHGVWVLVVRYEEDSTRPDQNRMRPFFRAFCTYNFGLFAQGDRAPFPSTPLPIPRKILAAEYLCVKSSVHGKRTALLAA